jgi:hypothetical protein
MIGSDIYGNTFPAAGVIKSYDLAASGVSAVFDVQCGMIRVVAIAETRLTFGTAPTASATGALLPMGAIEYFAVKIGESWKVAATGACNIVECA